MINLLFSWAITTYFLDTFNRHKVKKSGLAPKILSTVLLTMLILNIPASITTQNVLPLGDIAGLILAWVTKDKWREYRHRNQNDKLIAVEEKQKNKVNKTTNSANKIASKKH